MTIDPLESEWPNFRTLADVIKFTGLTADKDSLAGSLCYLLGLDGSDHPRIFVILAEDDFSKLREMWKVPVMAGGFITLRTPRRGNLDRVHSLEMPCCGWTPQESAITRRCCNYACFFCACQTEGQIEHGDKSDG